jgi:hypothetical protein
MARPLTLCLFSIGRAVFVSRNVFIAGTSSDIYWDNVPGSGRTCLVDFMAQM